MQFRLNSVSIIFACLLVFIGLFIDNQVEARSIQESLDDVSSQDSLIQRLALRKKRDTLTELENDNDETYDDQSSDDDQSNDDDESSDDDQYYDDDESYNDQSSNDSEETTNATDYGTQDYESVESTTATDNGSQNNEDGLNDEDLAGYYFPDDDVEQPSLDVQFDRQYLNNNQDDQDDQDNSYAYEDEY